MKLEKKCFIKNAHLIMCFAFMILLITSCGKTKNENTLRLEDSVVSTEYDFLDLSCSGETLIIAGESGVHTISLASGNDSKISDFSCSAIDANGDELFCFGDDKIHIMNLSGKDKEQYDLKAESFGVSKIDRIVGSKNYVVLFGYKTNSELLESKILLIDRMGSGITDLTDTMDRFNEINYVRGADFVSDNQLLMIIKPSTNLSNEANVIIKYDVEERSIINKDLLPHSSECCFCDGIVYYIENENVRGFDYTDGSKTLIKRFTKEMIEEKHGIEWIELNLKLAVIQDGILMASPYAKTVLIEKMEYNDKVLQILVPDDVDFYWMNQEQIADVEQEKQINIEIKELPAEYFKEKLTLKYMEHDSSFDIILYPHVRSDMGLQSIINNKLYYPITENDETLSVMDDLPVSCEIVEQKGSIFGLPWDFNYYFIDVNENLWMENGIPYPGEDLTIQNVWELCEYISHCEREIYVFNDMMEIMAYMINQWIENDATNLDALYEIIENCYKYTGILAPAVNGTYRTNIENSLYNINWKHSIFDDVNANNTKISKYPIYTDESPDYVNLSSVLLINPYTEKVELAKHVISRLAETRYTRLFVSNNKLDYAKPYLLSGGVANAVANALGNMDQMGASEMAEEIYRAVNMIING
ncbi:MAG: hypothetical protein IK132_08215 [Clostridia bacterium]|nr:hypothetical protein [Clostridia bacterium]